jgi:hypothetical protein
LADGLISQHVASLQPQLASILEKLGHVHVDLLHKLYNKELQVSRMESSEEFVPRSARIDFMFHMSKGASERPEFIALKEETDSQIHEFKKFLTCQIIKATKIECDSYADQLKDSFAKAVHVVVKGFLVGSEADDHDNCDSFVLTIFATHSVRLLKHTTFSSLDSFYERYKKVHNIAVFPIQSDSAANTATASQSRFFQPSVASTNGNGGNNVVHPGSMMDASSLRHIDSMSRAIESIFIMPFDEYLSQCKKNKISLELKKLSTSHFTDEATAATQMELDREPSLDHSQLQDLIRRQTKAENKLVLNEISKLQKQLQKLETKKSQRGRSPLGASTQKEIKNPSVPHSPSRQKKAAQKAAEADKDTNKNSRKQKQKKGQKNMKEKTSKSKTRRNK